MTTAVVDILSFTIARVACMKNLRSSNGTGRLIGFSDFRTGGGLAGRQGTGPRPAMHMHMFQ